MEFRDVVAKRRMVRNYSDEPVDADAVERILEAGIRAPSAGFSQGQRFVVITDAETRRAVAEIAHEPEYVAEGFDPWISKAPVHIVVCVDKQAYLQRYSEPDKAGPSGEASTDDDWPVPYWWVDAGASMMAVLYATVDEGLVAGFLGSHKIDELRSLLGIPDDVYAIGVVTIGHAAPDRRSGSLKRGRTPRGDVIHRGRWQSE